MPTVLTGKADSGTGGGAWAKLDVGVYDAVLESFESAPSAFEPDKERFQFNFRLTDEVDDNGDGIMMRYWANAVLSPRSTLASIIESLGHEWEVGEPFDVDELVGSECRLMVGRRIPKGKTKEDEHSFVQSVEPPKDEPAPVKLATKAPAAAVAADPCCVPGCKRESVIYDGEGNAFCEKHQPE
jgi:hypothetical protein